MIITQATLEDFDGIHALLKANHVDYIKEAEKVNGFVTTNMTDDQLTRLIVEQNGVTIAKESGKVLAFAFAAPWSFWKEWPFFAYMIEHLNGYQFEGKTLTTKNTYQYGPVCLDRSVRGSGTFERVFYASLATMRNRYPIMATFINQINGRSYAAHTRKVPMITAGTFDFNNNHYYLMACSTALTQGAVIRVAELRDIQAIADTYTALLTFEQENGGYSNWQLNVYPTVMVAETKVSAREMYVLEDGGEICASMVLNHDQADEYDAVNWQYPAKAEQVLVIHTLCIPPEKAGCGYGTKMVKYAKALARESGCKAIRIDTYSHNEPAKALYQKNGFRIAGYGDILLQGLIPEEQVYLEYRVGNDQV